MDTSKANSEPFIILHRAHEHLNRTIKTSAVAHCVLRDRIRQGTSEQQLRILAYADGGLWGGMPSWKEPLALVDEAVFDLGRSGVMRAFSILDRFLGGVEAEIERWNAVRPGHEVDTRAAMVPQTIEDAEVDDGDEEQEDRAFKVLRRMKWSEGQLVRIAPLLRYFRLTRNCVAHKSDRAGQALVRQSQSAELSKCLENWTKYTEEKSSPQLPPLQLNEAIPFTHQHALYASSVIRISARHINAQLVQHLGIEGMVAMAAYYSLLAANPLKQKAYRAPEKMVINMLSDRYRVQTVDTTAVISILRSLNLWQRCRLAHDQMLKLRTCSN